MRSDKDGNKCPSGRHRAEPLAGFVRYSMQAAVEQDRAGGENPDALLFLAGGCGTAAVVPRCYAGRGGLSGSARRLDAVSRCVPQRHSHWYSRRYRDRSDDRE